MANWAMTQILSGQATDAQTAAFAMGLHITGETPEQVAVLAATMLEFANLVPAIPGISAVYSKLLVSILTSQPIRLPRSPA